MKLPNSTKATIPKEKLTGYILSETHSIGKVVKVRTLWIIEKGKNIPRFITVYPV